MFVTNDKQWEYSEIWIFLWQCKHSCVWFVFQMPSPQTQHLQWRHPLHPLHPRQIRWDLEMVLFCAMQKQHQRNARDKRLQFVNHVTIFSLLCHFTWRLWPQSLSFHRQPLRHPPLHLLLCRRHLQAWGSNVISIDVCAGEYQSDIPRGAGPLWPKYRDQGSFLTSGMAPIGNAIMRRSVDVGASVVSSPCQKPPLLLNQPLKQQLSLVLSSFFGCASQQSRLVESCWRRDLHCSSASGAPSTRSGHDNSFSPSFGSVCFLFSDIKEWSKLFLTHCLCISENATEPVLVAKTTAEVIITFEEGIDKGIFQNIGTTTWLCCSATFRQNVTTWNHRCFMFTHSKLNELFVFYLQEF